MKKYLKIIIFIILVLFAAIYPFYLTNLYSYDEIWNFGFAKSILDGLIPYKDFSLIVPPLFPYLTALILGVFGKKLFIYYIFIAIITTTITFITSKKIGWNAILVYIALLIYSSNGYNTFSLLLLMILLLVIDKKIKHQDIFIPLIISASVLSKQTMALLIIPSLIYSKNKKKTMATYIACFLIFITYLLINNNLMQFLDYCLFGMFEFTEKNNLSIGIFLMLEIANCIALIITLIKSKGKRQDICYILLFQIIAFPITDISHCVLAWVPSIYLFFQKKNLTKFTTVAGFILVITAELGILLISNYTTTIQNKDYLTHNNNDTFLKGRLVSNVITTYMNQLPIFIEKYKDHELFVLGSNSYLIKLYLDIPINKYDLINAGNMGYKGGTKYIKEIDNTCKTKDCLFILYNNELTKSEYNQTDTNILTFVTDNYKQIYTTNVFSVYLN